MVNLTEFFKAAISQALTAPKAGQCLLVGALLFVNPGLTAAQEQQSINELKQSVLSQLEQHFQQVHEHLILGETLFVSVGNLDSRLRLARCTGDINTEIKQVSSNASITVKTSCREGARWTLYIPASVKTLQQVLIARRNLAKGETLEKSDLGYKSVNTAKLTGSYVEDMERLLGMELKRSIRANQVVKLNFVQAPNVIQKGETVVLRAKLSSLTVETEGTALSNGQVGQKIKVRNDKSRRIVDGLVTGPGQVLVAGR
ncbi:flagella basal body P-ring formation protein FlgA [Alteromonadaceae bacterium Bs31]|nr:flagella basal body P-ring formation protein FlgA [Alteromonadaceae bacterium Bs31]